MKTFAVFVSFTMLAAFINAQDPMFAPLKLPEIPSGCLVHVYGPLTSVPSYLPPDADSKSDWTGFFKSVGVAFPKGGFAYFYKPSKTLIVATTQPNFDLIETEILFSSK